MEGWLGEAVLIGKKLLECLLCLSKMCKKGRLILGCTKEDIFSVKSAYHVAQGMKKH